MNATLLHPDPPHVSDLPELRVVDVSVVVGSVVGVTVVAGSVVGVTVVAGSVVGVTVVAGSVVGVMGVACSVHRCCRTCWLSYRVPTGYICTFKVSLNI